MVEALLLTRAFGKMKPVRSMIVGCLVIGASMAINLYLAEKYKSPLWPADMAGVGLSPETSPGAWVRLFDAEGRLAGLGTRDDDGALRPHIVLI